jgi:hypothetical protein
MGSSGDLSLSKKIDVRKKVWTSIRTTERESDSFGWSFQSLTDSDQILNLV